MKVVQVIKFVKISYSCRRRLTFPWLSLVKIQSHEDITRQSNSQITPLLPLATVLLDRISLYLSLRSGFGVRSSLEHSSHLPLATNTKNALPDLAVYIGELGRTNFRLDEILQLNGSCFQLLYGGG